ncbi:uncharacterized protein LOC119660983 [Hermetia illucens]|uniref:uncharacterized protein LOC119660983 n=1 Tax=Hermetia illucens TaxID=343691 RepID=UPI0018CC2C06|nr:uncharacterized protein LOC119660983 [Hermetia illucens]
MSAKRSKMALPGELSSEEEGSTSPSENYDYPLRKDLEELRGEKAALAQQLECQQQLIIQLKQEVAALQEAMRTSVGRNNREPIVIDSGGAPAAIEDSTRANEECEMDSVGPSPSPNPEVNDEGDPFNFVRRRKHNKIKVSVKTVTAPKQAHRPKLFNCAQMCQVDKIPSSRGMRKTGDRRASLLQLRPSWPPSELSRVPSL